MASNSHNRTRARLRRRVYWLWGLCLLSVYLVGLPLLPMLALALIWRPGATDTRYESHIRTALRTGGLALVVLLMALVALAVDPLVGMAIAAAMLLWLFVVAWIGLFRTARDRRFPPLLRRRKPQEYPSYGY